MTDGNKEMATNPAMASTEPGRSVTGLIPPGPRHFGRIRPGLPQEVAPAPTRAAPNARDAERTKLGRVGHEKPGRTERALEN